MASEQKPSGNDEAWLALQCEHLRNRLLREGVSGGRAEVVLAIFTEKVKKGVPASYAERHIQTDILRAKRETEIDQLPTTLAQRYHLPVDRVQAVIKRDMTRLRANLRLLIPMVMEKHQSRLAALSRAAYEERRAEESTMARALVVAKVRQ